MKKLGQAIAYFEDAIRESDEIITEDSNLRPFEVRCTNCEHIGYRCKGGHTMNRFKCPACGGNQYTACDTAEWCIYCGHQKLEKMDKLEPEESEGLE
jgi:hypothetical protein